MTTLNDEILRGTGGPTINDGLARFFGKTANESMNDAEHRWLLEQPGVTGGAINDMWYQFLRAEPHNLTGSNNDMKLKFWGGVISAADFTAIFDDTTIIGTIPPTAWNNKKFSAQQFNLNVTVGDTANLSVLENGVALLLGEPGDRFTTPDSVANSITGDIDATIDAALQSWLVSGEILIAKSTSALDQRGWRFRVNGSALEFRFSTDGIDSVIVTSTNPHGLADGTRHTIRMTRNATTGDVTYYIDDNLLEVLTGPAGPMFDNTADVEVGSQNDGGSVFMNGKIYSAQVYDGIDGTLVLDFDPTRATSSNAGESFDSVTGEIWTGQGDAFVNASGYTGIYSRGGAGFRVTAPQPVSVPSVAFVVYKPAAVLALDNQFLFDGDPTGRTALSAKPTPNNSYHLYQGDTETFITDSLGGDLRVISAEYKGTADTKMAVSEVGSVTGFAGNFDPWEFGHVFMDSLEARFAKGLFLFFGVHEGELPENQIAEIRTLLENKYRIPSAFSPEVRDVFNRMSALTGTEQTAIAALVDGLISDGLYSKVTEIYAPCLNATDYLTGFKFMTLIESAEVPVHTPGQYVEFDATHYLLDPVDFDTFAAQDGFMGCYNVLPNPDNNSGARICGAFTDPPVLYCIFSWLGDATDDTDARYNATSSLPRFPNPVRPTGDLVGVGMIGTEGFELQVGGVIASIERTPSDIIAVPMGWGVWNRDTTPTGSTQTHHQSLMFHSNNVTPSEVVTIRARVLQFLRDIGVTGIPAT